MQDIQSDAQAAKPLWRRIVDFPLVAMLIAVAIYAAAAALDLLIIKLIPPMRSTGALLLGAVLSVTIFIGAYKLLIRHLGEQRHDDFAWRDSAKYLAAGLLFGLVLMSAVVGFAAVADVYNIVGPGGTSRLLITFVNIGLLAGLTEELLFRGILFRWIEEFAGSWVALALTSALFGLAHIFNPNASLLASFAIALEAGVLLGGAYMLTRNLWFPIGLHAGWNFTQGEIWDVPVSGLDQNGLVQAKLSGSEILSGGGFGLEASLFAMVICTAVGVWLVMWAINRGRLVRPWWVRRRLAGPALEAEVG